MIPVFLVIVFNVIMVIVGTLVVFSHNRKKAKRLESSRSQVLKTNLKALLSILGLTVIFGLTWLLGALTVLDTENVVQYLFVLCNAFQGFYIFIFVCILSSEGREMWKDVLYTRGFRRLSTFVSSTGSTLLRSSKAESAAHFTVASPTTTLKPLVLGQEHQVRSVGLAQGNFLGKVEKVEVSRMEVSALFSNMEAIVDDNATAESPAGDAMPGEEGPTAHSLAKVKGDPMSGDEELVISLSATDTWEQLKMASVESGVAGIPVELDVVLSVNREDDGSDSDDESTSL